MAIGLARAALGILLVTGLAGCGSTGGDGSSGSSKLANIIFLNQANPPPAPEPIQKVAIACPPTTVLPGTSSIQVYAPGGEGDPFSLRHQVSVGEIARECINLGAEVAIRVGVQGRILAGPKGGGGSVDVPVRVVLVDAKDNPVYSNLTRVRVALPAGQASQTFTHVEEGLTVPLPPRGLRGYRILVGFDAQGRDGGKTGRRG